MIRQKHNFSRQCESQWNAASEVQITLPRLVSQAMRWTTVRKRLQSIGATFCFGCGCGLLGGAASNVSLAQTGEAKHYPASNPGMHINFQPASGGDEFTAAASSDASKRHQPLPAAKLASNILLIPRPQDERDASAVEELSSAQSQQGAHSGVIANGIQTIPYLESPASRPRELLPVPTRTTSRPWMDIRPRSPDQENPSLIPVTELPADVSHRPPTTGIPQLVQVHNVHLTQRDFCASALFYHRPLYFEDCCLERYGATPGVFGCAPAVQSGLHFFAKTAMLPMSMLHEPPHSCVHSGCTCR